MIMINKALDLFSKSLEFISWIPKHSPQSKI